MPGKTVYDSTLQGFSDVIGQLKSMEHQVSKPSGKISIGHEDSVPEKGTAQWINISLPYSTVISCSPALKKDGSRVSDKFGNKLNKVLIRVPRGTEVGGCAVGGLKAEFPIKEKAFTTAKKTGRLSVGISPYKAKKLFGINDSGRTEVYVQPDRLSALAHSMESNGRKITESVQPEVAGKLNRIRSKESIRDTAEGFKRRRNEPIQKSSQFVSIRFKRDDLRIGKDWKTGKPARLNCTLPAGTVVNGQDLSGAKMSVPWKNWMGRALRSQHVVSVSIDKGESANVYTVNKFERGKSKYSNIPDISPIDLKAAVDFAYGCEEDLPREEQDRGHGNQSLSELCDEKGEEAELFASRTGREDRPIDEVR